MAKKNPKCSKCGEPAMTVSLEAAGKKTPPLCERCFHEAVDALAREVISTAEDRTKVLALLRDRAEDDTELLRQMAAGAPKREILSERQIVRDLPSAGARGS